MAITYGTKWAWTSDGGGHGSPYQLGNCPSDMILIPAPPEDFGGPTTHYFDQPTGAWVAVEPTEEQPSDPVDNPNTV